MEFDEQVVRLEGLQDIADRFVRVRVTNMAGVNLNLFKFDYDLTFMVFFLNADEHIYGRYGGRDEKDADARQSLAGLKYAMKAALESHDSYRPKPNAKKPQFKSVRDYSRRTRGCVHCHQAKEMIYDDLKRKGQWSRDLLWRHPLPDNLGMNLEVDRGNVVQNVKGNSSASAAGLRSGDVIRMLGETPVHSIGDAQHALDLAPRKGSLSIAYKRDGKLIKSILELKDGWRRSPIDWRGSMRDQIPSARVYGRDLNTNERKKYGLQPKQLAFWQGYPVNAHAKAAGVSEGDIILGFDDRILELEAYDFLSYVRRNYLVGDRVTVNVIRDGKRIELKMNLK